MFVMSLTDNELLILVDGWQFPPIGDVEKISHLPACNESFTPFLNWALQFEFNKGTTVVHHTSNRQVHDSFKWIETVDVHTPEHYQVLQEQYDNIFVCGFHLQSCVANIANVIAEYKQKISHLVLNLSLPWPNSPHNCFDCFVPSERKFNYYMWRSNTNFTSFSLHQQIG